jgi:hypothetical protein
LIGLQIGFRRERREVWDTAGERERNDMAKGRDFSIGCCGHSPKALGSPRNTALADRLHCEKSDARVFVIEAGERKRPSHLAPDFAQASEILCHVLRPGSGVRRWQHHGFAWVLSCKLGEAPQRMQALNGGATGKRGIDERKIIPAIHQLKLRLHPHALVGVAE